MHERPEAMYRAAAMKIAGINPPSLRTLEGESDRSASWLELFYDLAFVVAVAVLGGRLLETHDFAGVLSYLAYFLLIWWLWASHTFYADRYDTDDLVYRILATAQLAAVAIIAASLTAGPSESSAWFAVGYTVARLALLVMYWRARRHVVATRALVNGYLVGFGAAAILWVISIFVDEPLRFTLWAVAIAIDLATPWVMRKEQARVPLDVSHLPERFGLFTILVLGESIAATVVGLSHVDWTGPATFSGVLALVVATAIWWLYFDNVEGMVVRRDPNAEHDWRPTIWIYSHLGIAAGLVMTAIGLEHAITEAGHEFPCPGDDASGFWVRRDLCTPQSCGLHEVLRRRAHHRARAFRVDVFTGDGAGPGCDSGDNGCQWGPHESVVGDLEQTHRFVESLEGNRPPIGVFEGLPDR
jgi:low temperature requirement protein LtrA